MFVKPSAVNTPSTTEVTTPEYLLRIERKGVLNFFFETLDLV